MIRQTRAAALLALQGTFLNRLRLVILLAVVVLLIALAFPFSGTLVPANAQRQAHQDRNQGGQPFPLHDISDGGSGCAEDALSGNPCPNPAVAFFDNIYKAGMMFGIAENRVLEWSSTVAVYQNSEKKTDS